MPFAVRFYIFGRTTQQLTVSVLFLEKIIPKPLSGFGSMPVGTIVAIVAGISVFLVVVFMLFFLRYRRQEKKLLFYKHRYFLRTKKYSVSLSCFLTISA